MEEVELDFPSPPVASVEELMMEHICLVRRHDLWEQHGNARIPSVRVLDDFLEWVAREGAPALAEDKPGVARQRAITHHQPTYQSNP